jgi:hypothetical protein
MTSERTYPSFHARLRVVGDALDPDQVTERLRLTPTRVCRAGDIRQRPRATIIEKRGWWEVASRISTELPLAEHIDDVLSVVNESSEAIAALAEEFEVWLSCVVYAENVPELILSARQVSAVARLGASLDFDVILLPAKALIAEIPKAP